MKRAVVTGCTSFLGIALIRYMESMDIEVYAVARPGSSRLAAVPASRSIHLIQSELSQLDDIRLPDEKMDAFFHIGWTSDFNDPRYNREGQKLNVECAEKAMRLAQQSGCDVFLGVGSQAECGIVEGCITPDTPEAPLTEYAKAKTAAFHKLAQMSEKSGIRQSNISRIENGNAVPRLDTLCALAAAMGKKLRISII